MASCLYFLLPAVGGYGLVSYFLFKRPHILHRKKHTAFRCTHISHRGGDEFGVCVCVCLGVCLCVRGAGGYKCVCVCVWECLCGCVCVWVCVCMCVCVCVCVWVCVFRMEQRCL